MTVAAGPFAVAALLLVLAGIAKARRPADTVVALRAAGLPATSVLVRAGALAEVAIGGSALASGDRATAILVALSYAAFTLFVVTALRRATPLASCGCFGKPDTPPTWTHVVITGAATCAAIVVAADPTAGLPDVLKSQPYTGLPFVLLLLCGTLLAYVAMSTLPRTSTLLRDAKAARTPAEDQSWGTT